MCESSPCKEERKAVREAGGVINTNVTIAPSMTIVRKTDRTLLSENCGPITLLTGQNLYFTGLGLSNEGEVPLQRFRSAILKN